MVHSDDKQTNAANLGISKTDLAREIRRLTRVEQKLMNEIDALRHRAREAERLLRASERARLSMLHSSTWRVGAPLRAIKSYSRSLYSRLVDPPFRRRAETQPSSYISKPQGATAAQSESNELIETGLFDAQFYRITYPDQITDASPADHFCTVGWQKKLNPSERFNTAAYIAANPNITQNPVIHYWRRVNVRRTDRWSPGRLAVFSAIAGGYDEIQEPAYVDENIDYILFTDGDVPESSVWKKRPFDYYHADPTRTARYVKTHPHLYLSEYSHSIWLDANLRLAVHPHEILREVPSDVRFATWHHPLRDCVFDEAAEVVKRSKDVRDVVEDQIRRYRELAFPAKSGLYETSVIVRNHEDGEVISAMNRWWKEIDNGSKRDQISLPVALKDSGLQIDFLAEAGICMRSDYRVIYSRHSQAQKT